MRPEEKITRHVFAYLAKAVKDARLRQSLSMLAVAEKAGLSQQMVSYVERGIRNPSLDTLLRITGVLRLDLGDLITRALSKGGENWAIANRAGLPRKVDANLGYFEFV